jgi:chromosome segregation protein
VLKLKKLQILGFKSFCDRAELKFHGDGIAAIVGPNGCGKSNIADAISWVLGEQSAKTLRGSRMEDVIFAGTRDRQPTGMAEVSLTLIDPDVYEGGDVSEPEIEVVDAIPEEDWDEASVRAQAAAETEAHIAEVQPLSPEEQPEGVGSREQGVGAVAEGGAAEQSAEVQPDDASHPGVVLKIRRRRFKRQEFKAGQLVITRRLFRTGDSEYLLNGRLCRLRDIQELFMGTGLGPESYALIEQGRIGQILSSKPHDRRAIIEEAAGITKFKTKKRLAELRLEEAKQNLARLNDIFEEVTRQMNSLKRQASKAERYVRLRDEMKARLKVVLASKLAQLAREAEALEAELEALAQEMSFRAGAAQEMEEGQSQTRARGYAIENELRQNSERASDITLEIDRSLAQRRHNEERCRELALRAEVGEADLARAEAQMSALTAELEVNQGVLATAAANEADGRAEAAARQQEAAEAAEALVAVEQQQEQRRLEIMEVVAAAAEVRNLITQAEEHRAALDREAARLEQEISVAIAAMESSGGRRGQLTLEFESVSQRVAWLGLQIESMRRELETTRAEESASKRRMDTLRAEFATALGKKASLEAVIAEHGYSTESVKRLFQSGAMQEGFAPAGVLADFLEVEGQYEHVVEDFLRDELNYVVVKSWDAADEGLRLLRGDVEGRATFLVHPEDSQAKFSFALDESGRTRPRPERIVPLKNCIRVLNGFGQSLEVILSKLGNGYITPDPFLARELALENPEAFFLSQTGECFHNVTVTGGRQRTEGPLSLKRELREVTRQLEVIEKTLGTEEQRAAKLTRRVAELERMLGEMEQQRLDAEKQALTASHVLDQLAAELERNQQRRETFSREWEQVKAASAEKQVFLVAKQAEAGMHELHRAELESQRASAQEELVALKAARDAAAHIAAEVGARLAALEAQRTAAAAALQRIETLASDARMRIDGLKSRLAAAAEERQEREQENLHIAERLEALEAERAAAQARSAELQAESDVVRTRLAEIEQQLRETRLALDQGRDRRGELSAAAAKLQADTEYMEQTAINDLGIVAGELRSDPAIPFVDGEQLAAEEAMYREMKTRLENMGPVNMMALEEYQETAQRHAFLETQRKDLLDSIENTQNTIREIDVYSRQRFQEAFGKINENFQATFRKLFGGGNAFMRLTDEENTAESGIDVVASPPGKKLQNVLLLSGGEKALTALALLVGIFQYQPSPFCILDEVDAPLDETNIGRFIELVKQMSNTTQFVLITHSKKTMSVAPVMYGVTMQEAGVSKLVSVKFGEPECERATA